MHYVLRPLLAALTVPMEKKLHPKFEAEIEQESIVACGTWFYQNEVPYKAKLVKTKWNYTSFDLPVLDEILEVPFCDYIRYQISDEGVLYHWEFEGPAGTTTTEPFSTYFSARDHLNTYGYTYEIVWSSNS